MCYLLGLRRNTNDTSSGGDEGGESAQSEMKQEVLNLRSQNVSDKNLSLARWLGKNKEEVVPP